MSGFWRRRSVRLTACWTAAAVVIAGFFFWLTGGYDAWRNDRALDTVCDGDVAAEQVRKLFPDVELESWDTARSGVRHCYLRAADEEKDGRAAVTLGIWRTSDSSVSFEAGRFSAPLGHGWTGSFNYDPDVRSDDHDEAKATLLLDCGKEPRDGLLVTVDASLGRGDFDEPAARTRLTAVLTGTAERYAKRTGCKAPMGKPVKDVGVVTTTWDYKPLAKASGSCAGIVTPAEARRWGVQTAVEIAAAPAPIESCSLGGFKASGLYDFRAYYGPFAEEELSKGSYDSRDDDKADSPDGSYALSAECRGAQGTALFTVESLHDEWDRGRAATVVDHKGLRAALKRFAERSAAWHGCGKPAAR
ncbi:hypothetical protein [Streptomyces sp. NPDC005408]|uniref:hypothetical protein n=1 Tax=Streptomyces sp. NPDC005408 TaxID=3155341 RepID=UPI0033A69D29